MRVAVIGASGAVGREMLNELEALVPNDVAMDVGLFASPRSAGTRMNFRAKNLDVKAYDLALLKGYDYALMSAGGAFSRQHAKAIAAQGTTVIDNSSAWRMDEQTPLVVPEVNGDVLDAWPHRVSSGKPLIIANPNCSTIQMVMALKPLKDEFGLKKVIVSTYQSVSGTGQKGIKELGDQVEAHFKFKEIRPHTYAQPIAFNVLPAIDVLDQAGHCFEEEKMVRETRKLLGMAHLDVLATTVCVPVFQCHSESLSVQLGSSVTVEKALSVLKNFPGLQLHTEHDHSSFPTPRGVAGDRRTWIARVRTPLGSSTSDWLQFWVVADNLKKGAATNAVQILEYLRALKK